MGALPSYFYQTQNDTGTTPPMNGSESKFPPTQSDGSQSPLFGSPPLNLSNEPVSVSSFANNGYYGQLSDVSANGSSGGSRRSSMSSHSNSSSTMSPVSDASSSMSGGSIFDYSQNIGQPRMSLIQRSFNGMLLDDRQLTNTPGLTAGIVQPFPFTPVPTFPTFPNVAQGPIMAQPLFLPQVTAMTLSGTPASMLGTSPVFSLTGESSRTDATTMKRLRNRVSAYRSRMRKKSWLIEMHNNITTLAKENDELERKISLLRDNVRLAQQRRLLKSE